MGTIAHIYALHFRAKIRYLVMLVKFGEQFGKKQCKTKNLKVILDRLKVGNFKGAPGQNMKAGDPVFCIGPHLYIFQGWYEKSAPKQPGRQCL